MIYSALKRDLLFIKLMVWLNLLVNVLIVWKVFGL